MPLKIDSVRFWNKVAPGTGDECWPWTGAKDRDGYGTYGLVPGQTRKVHRIAFMLQHGVELPSEVLVLHRCDNSSCANPAHLFTGTHLDNMRDKIAKGRANQSRSNNNASKLTEAKARKIKAWRGRGMKLKDIAERLGVSQALVCTVAKGKAWS